MKKGRAKLDADQQFLIIASPMCKAFSQLMELFNYPKTSQAVVGELVQEAMEHLKFCLELCLRQHAEGRLFIFEHPDAAASWSIEMINSIA